ncbi:class I adenylate-forming enzyme family protein [Aidingimonas halophila]|uniref:Crotonobetaine/carnitine-CoA ligase n=1 Tax=Aidingimonas halophila TaxID=574349 RepID=A0A1H3GTQ0_9GAMM|nr:AMP-binding protein [Aidingimonas halophila]GHC35937.1 ATP-dependent acyl-CoA ligase [Aidingimonas halophila]SDY06487.1 crotonobetaine/carnitine-CoA ligase [Aidingimonas halophila]
MRFSLEDPSFILALRDIAAREPESVFGTFDHQPLTFGTLDRQAEALAVHLRQGLGIQPGERAAVMMNNGPEAISILFALAKAGIVWVPVNARQRGRGLKYIIEHCDPALLFADANLMPVIDDSGAEIAGQTLLLGGENDAVSDILAGDARLEAPAPAMSALYALMYTSGTTGKPKGVRVTHAMMAYALKSVELLCSIKPGDVFFQWEPFYHIGGAQMLLLPLFFDVRLSLTERFSASRFWEQVSASGATHIHYLGGVLQILLKQPPSDLETRHNVRIAWGGGCPSEIWPALQERFGFEIRECYGMTEASSLTTCNAEGRQGSVGRTVPWLDIAIHDEHGHLMPTGEPGQIVVRETQPGVLFDGYFRNAEASEKAMTNGRLNTGDRGWLDADGYLYFLGRITDSVRCRGENVSAWEVETVTQQHPDVEECAMIGVEAEIGEQDIKLFLKPKTGHMIEPNELYHWLQKRLASYQCPRYLTVVDEFERTPSHRIVKHRLPTSVHEAWDSQQQLSP